MDDENNATAPRKRLPRGQGWLLRQQIIDTAMDLIRRSGEARAPSARELTRALGITAPSFYRHFSSTDELADALCSRYFEQLGEALQRATSNIAAGVERLHTLGLAYVRFAAQNPLMYRFATTRPPRRGIESDEILNSSAFFASSRRCSGTRRRGTVPAGQYPGTGLATVGDHAWGCLAARHQAATAVGRAGVLCLPDPVHRVSGSRGGGCAGPDAWC